MRLDPPPRSLCLLDSGCPFASFWQICPDIPFFIQHCSPLELFAQILGCYCFSRISENKADSLCQSVAATRTFRRVPRKFRLAHYLGEESHSCPLLTIHADPVGGGLFVVLRSGNLVVEQPAAFVDRLEQSKKTRDVAGRLHPVSPLAEQIVFNTPPDLVYVRLLRLQLATCTVLSWRN